MQSSDSVLRRPVQVYKIINIGESNVGKSSLFLRYTQDTFRDTIANTIGIDNKFKELVIDGTSVHLQLWDTAGQERFQSIIRAYYREVDGFIFVYDVNVDRSYEYMVQRLEEMRETMDPQFSIVVGNKIDGLTEPQCQTEEKRLAGLAGKYGIRYRLTSAKTGQNVSELFEDLGRELFHNKPRDRPARNAVDMTKKRRRFFGCFR